MYKIYKNLDCVSNADALRTVNGVERKALRTGNEIISQKKEGTDKRRKKKEINSIGKGSILLSLNLVVIRIG